MTPKEKAKELVENMASPLDVIKINLDSKRCALIALEQIETITKHYPPDYMLTVYWKQVKQEIEAL